MNCGQTFIRTKITNRLLDHDRTTAMGRSLNDHEIKFLADAELYLALKHLAENDDRSLSDYLRHLARCHVREKVSGLDRRSSSDRPEPGLFGLNREAA